MKKYFSRKYLKRELALLLAVSMVFTTNVFGMDTVSAETVESTTESEDAAVQNDNDTALEEGEDSEGINEDFEPISENEGDEDPDGVNEESGSLPDNEDGEDPEEVNEESGSLPDNEDENRPVEDEERLQDADDVEELVAEVSENGERIGEPSYRVLKLDDEASFNEVKDDKDLLQDKTWNETDNLDTYLADSGMEYVVIRATQASESKKLELPANIKGAMLVRVPGMDEEVEWQLNELSIKGAATSVYLYNLVINTDGSKFTIDFSAAGENSSKVVLERNVVNAQIYCASTAGTIGFIWDNIIKGYSVKCETRFEKTEEWDFVDLLINGEAGLSFEEITSDANTSIVFNGYPKNTESLPRFNKKIKLGESTGEDNGSIGLSFWEHKDNPFWLDESIGDGWWEAESAESLEKGTQIAYFAGTTRAEQELIGCNVHYYAHGTDNSLYLNSRTGRLEKDGEEEERAAYSVLKLNDEASFDEVKKDKAIIWDTYDDSWEETDYLDQYLARDGMKYVVIQATKTSHNSENKSMELPANIKGVMLIYGWDDKANDGEGDSMEWQLDTISIKGAETSVYLYDLAIDTVGNEKFTIDFSADEKNASKVVFKETVVNAQIYCESETGTIGFAGGNILSGYFTKCETEFLKHLDWPDYPEHANLMINGEAGLSFEEITGDMGVTIVFNGYPENIESLPRFNKKINLGKGIDDEGNEYDRGIDIAFWQYKESPFGLDGTEDWWEAEPAESLEKGTQIAYFAGLTKNERDLIGHKVYYYSHDNEDGTNNNEGLYLNSATGRLEKDGEEEERAAYGVLKLENKAAFDKLMEDDSPLWDEESEEYYGDLWDETDYLDEYLARDGMEYVVIQATKTSHNSENKSLELPANIKGAMLVNEWDDAVDAAVEWQLNELNIKGTETCVFLSGNIIDTVGNEKLTIVFSAEETNKSEVICGDIVVNAQINCDSTAGTIGFINNNILKGYSVKCKTEFHDNGNLLINGETGISFEEITGDTNAQIIFNGYPENPESLPHFNKEINLGMGIDEEGNECEQGIGIGFWEYKELPFWLDESRGDDYDWRQEGEDSSLNLEAGTQVAYFAGLTENERDLIGRNVYYNTYSEDNNLHINSYTGKLEDDNAEWEGLAYRVLKLDDKTAFDTIIESNVIPWNDERWDATETDYLDNYLARGGMEYVIIQATRALNNSENKSLELPENIKGVLLLSEHYEEDQEDHVAAWQLNTIKAEGGKEIHIFDAGIDPMNHESEDSDVEPENPGLKIETMEADVNVVIENSEIMGDLSLSGIADIKFIESKVFGALDLGSNKPTVSLEGMIVADNLYGYSALKIYGDTTFIVRYHGEVVIENCEFIKTNGEGEGQGVTLIYNGYPKDASVLPVFKDNIVTPQNFGINLRFVEQSNEFFWEEEDWFDNVPDEILPSGTQIAVADIPGEKFEGLPLDYYTKEVENPDNPIHTELIRDDEGRVLIKQTNSESGKQIVGFALSVDSEKEYDGTAFEIDKASVFNNCGYAGNVELAWESKDGTPLEEAPKDAGEYLLKASVPEGTEGYEGSNKIAVVITARTVTVSVRPHATETRIAPVDYDIIWTGFVNGDTYVKQAEVEEGAETTDETGKYYILSIKGGEVSSNYTIAHGEPVRVTITEDTKPCINSVLFPKKKAEYSAVYTGEQIRPVMVVAYTYSEKGRTKTQKLKLNVDYTVTYTNNVNVGTNTAEVTVEGIGEYTGVITKEFSITPKSIKKVTLSPVGDIRYEDILNGEKPTVTVIDGTYELVEGEDYVIVDGDGNEVDDWSKKGSETADTQSALKVKGIGNYNETSKKSVKFNILKTSTEIKSIENVTVEFKKPDKVYTYNGKAQKPAVVVKDGGVKVPASQYKVIYTNNVNAGTQTAIVKVVGVSKKGQGYYGVSATELKFDIKQKDFSKVSVSSIAARPKSGSLDYITMTVKDGKHILTEDVDYTVDYSNIANEDGSLKDVVIGQKYEVTLRPVSGGNYTDTSSKTVKVKFGQLNLASKTAAVSVKIKDAANNKVEVKYNGTLLTEGTDYTAQVKQDKNKSTYTVTIKAVKKAAYKGKKVVKNLTVESEESEE